MTEAPDLTVTRTATREMEGEDAPEWLRGLAEFAQHADWSNYTLADLSVTAQGTARVGKDAVEEVIGAGISWTSGLTAEEKAMEIASAVASKAVGGNTVLVHEVDDKAIGRAAEKAVIAPASMEARLRLAAGAGVDLGVGVGMKARAQAETTLIQRTDISDQPPADLRELFCSA